MDDEASDRASSLPEDRGCRDEGRSCGRETIRILRGRAEGDEERGGKMVRRVPTDS